MTDLVKDLREEHGNPLEWSAIKRLEERCAKAAEAIERLEAELAEANESADKFCEQSLRDLGAAAKLEEQLAEARAENERVSEALKMLGKKHDELFRSDYYGREHEVEPVLEAYTTCINAVAKALAAPALEPSGVHEFKPDNAPGAIGLCWLCAEPANSPRHIKPTEREAERPITGQIWKHANGNKYVIVAMANIELGKEDKFPLSVIYRNTLRDTLYVRRMSDWPGRMTLAAQQQALESDETRED